MNPSKTILITGTHHTPAIELIKLLQSDRRTNWQIHYIGHLYPHETHIAHTIIPKLKIPFYNLNSGKFDRKNFLRTLAGIPRIFLSFFQSLNLLRRIKPDIVISFGGYVSVPVIVAAYFKKIPSITHEQTLTESLATKINRLFVTKVALSFPPAVFRQKDVVTGNLIRTAIFDQSSTKFSQLKKPIIYITGGNQGSEFINRLVVELLPDLTKYSIIHQTGKKTVLHSKFPHYHHFEYIEIEDIGWVLNHADIIISRAGANICQEIDLLNKNAILIPLIFTQQDEQTKNAFWLQNRHPQNVVVIPQLQANAHRVLSAIQQLPASSSRPSRPPASSPLINLIYELI